MVKGIVLGRSSLMLSFALIAGFLGGAVSSRLLSPEPAAAQGVQRVVAAQSFVLVDNAGRTRAELMMRDGASPGLWIYGADGNVRVGLAQNIGGNGLALYDSRDNAIDMSVTDQDQRHIFLFSPSGPSVPVALAVDSDGTGRAHLDFLNGRNVNELLGP